ncbi:D-isomer specific 2-hydroxyacid dehydrogenase family protein [Corynebacterium pseudopelargi]|uniref:Glyoxylate/hydroxypyruvate reductase B n=1 Tax=Corynebacterium pseudopelargi TaxID=2080757 RepID=A0A3G6IX37_9CORY|nr:D-isomer specific 2-hydroxyacid dehydrogenase family protein [Corynebacterium pseudopelargi]AZA08680.1 Glyoxylate/hydroxypyruvate reductase B [Corynebacterium pseudopelargi]
MKFAMMPQRWDMPAQALIDAGHEEVELDQADFLVFNGTEDFPELPENIQYVQVAFAGMDALRKQGVLDARVRWANAAGLYADTVAESTLAMLLAVGHKYPAIINAKSWGIRPLPDQHTNWLYDDKTLAIIGAGGIAGRLLEFVSGFPLHTIAVNTSGKPVEGADETFSIEQVEQVWPRADYVVLLAPLTEATEHMVNASVFAQLPNHAVLINVGRGGLVCTEDLVAALEQGQIGGAALDVTEPEPLPDGHPLWQMDNVLITPHVANTSERMQHLLGPLFVENARRFAQGETMLTEVEPAKGY